ncbi:MAG: adaptor protein MecA [Ruminococcus sp.]|nr:adaptor protein MecA [Ruminococcus sp.]
MTIEQLSASKVLISLGSEDIESFDLDFDKMGLCSDHSRRILLRLLQIACRKTGMSCKSKTVMMEALPHQGGCLLLVTVVDKKKKKAYRIKRIYESLVYEFEDAEKVLSIAEALHRSNASVGGNSLWLYAGKYYIVPDRPFLYSSSRARLKEYAREIYIASAFMSRIKEAGRVLCRDNALELIGSKMYKKPL